MASAQEDVSLRPLAQTFVWPELEAAYERRHTAVFSTPTLALVYCALSLVALLPFLVVAAFSQWSTRRLSQCADQYHVFFASASSAMCVALCIVRATLGFEWFSKLQPAFFVVINVGFSAETVLVLASCPKFDYGPGVAHMPPAMMPTYSIIIQTLIFLFCSTCTWPKSAMFSGTVQALQLVALAVLTSSTGEYMWLLFLFGMTVILTIVFSVFVSWDRRKSFANSIMVERERLQAAHEMAVTNSLIEALFPRDIAQRLIRCRAESVPRTISQAYNIAAVVLVTVDGLESIGPCEKQLRVLSQIFVHADNAADNCGATKLKSINNSLIYADRRQDLNASRILLKIGVSVGPIVAGVIGITKPRYDCWGYTVDIARKLSLDAMPGEILVTRELVMNYKETFLFECNAPSRVYGVGEVATFRLIPRVLQRFPSLRNPDIKPFSVSPRRDIRLSEAFESGFDVYVGPLGILFTDWDSEYEFLSYYAVKYSSQLCKISLTAATFYLFFLILGGFFNHSAIRFAFMGSQTLALCCVALCTFFRLKYSPIAYFGIVFALLLVATLVMMVPWDTNDIKDPLLCGILGWISLLHIMKIPFYLAAPMSVLTTLASIPLFTTWNYPIDSLIVEVSQLVTLMAVNWICERTIRRNFRASSEIMANKQCNVQARKSGEILLESVVPAQILSRLREDTLVFTAHVPLGTALEYPCSVPDAFLLRPGQPPQQDRPAAASIDDAVGM
eukprot:m51a1_g9277 putative adenylate cyclase (732) ;mRNA; r:108981-112972